MARVITGSFFIVFLVYCSLVSTERGLASLYANPGKSTLSLWRAGKLQPQQHGWERVRSSLDKALSYDSHNPDLLYEMGEAYDAAVAVSPIGDPAARKNRDSARQYYIAALNGQPTWPYAWIALALVEYRLDHVDAEFYRALHRSVALGPWEPSVKYRIADIGLHHWQKLDINMRAFITGIVHRAVSNQDTAMDMLGLLRRYDMLDMVCNDNVADESIGQYCKPYHHP
jgi:tetratricopeptide (TPR) repeat protein